MAASIGRAPATIRRLIGGGQFHDVIVDPRDANILFATQTSLYRSTDAGKTWESYAGAPSGADYNYVWIDPTNDKYMILAVDQGTEISMDARPHLDHLVQPAHRPDVQRHHRPRVSVLPVLGAAG